MRMSNILGALVAFLFAVALDAFLLTRIYAWIQTIATGDILILLEISLITVIVFITLGIPAMIATQDNVEKL